MARCALLHSHLLTVSLLDGVDLGKDDDDGCYDGREEGEKAPHHRQYRVGDAGGVDTGVAHGVGDHAGTGQSEEEGYEGAADSGAELLGHGAAAEDETRG